MATWYCRIRSTPAHVALLEHLDARGIAAADHVYRRDGWLHVALDEAALRALEEHGVEVERGESVAAAARERLRERAAPRAPADGDVFASGFVDHYMDAAEVAARMQALAAEFPALCQLSTLPFATSGYDGAAPGLGGPGAVQLLRITNAPAVHSRPGLLLVCGTHAREWINPLIAVELAEQLLRNFDPASADPAVQAATRIVQQGDVFIIPVLNPDGLNFSVHDEADWRKNRRPNAGAPGCPGVDNNRNYEVYFGGTGSGATACTDTYHGPSAFSEPENRNVRHVLEQHPNILIGVDSHSAGDQIYRPTVSGGSYIASLPVFPEDEAVYTQLEATANAAIQAVSGKTFGTGTTSNHAGTSDEYMFFAHRVFAFDFECAASFQPPIAQALASVQEVCAAMRALAGAALDLDVQPVTASRVVQCLDRTSSMIAFGYEASARDNARRFADMMSIGDSLGLVSFADPSPNPMATPPDLRAKVEQPLTLLDDAGDFALARAAVDAVSFGGWTSIGAGLQKAAAELAGAAAPRAIVLLSDGFENREPSAASVLAGLPPGLRVFTIALGAVADTALLQNIATTTGGAFYLSPTALELHEVYNQIRADVSDDDVSLNVADGGGGADSYAAYVEHGATRLTASLSWTGAGRTALVVEDPSGRRVRDDDWGVRRSGGARYALLRIARPRPGRWTLRVAGVSGARAVAAFVRSPVRLRVLPHVVLAGHRRRVTFAVDARVGHTPAALVALAQVHAMPAGSVKPPAPVEALRAWSDTPPAELRATFAAGFSHPPARVAALRLRHAAPVAKPAALPRGPAEAAWLGLPEPLTKPGFHNVRLSLEGTLPGGYRFERARLVTIGGPT